MTPSHGDTCFSGVPDVYDDTSWSWESYKCLRVKNEIDFTISFTKLCEMYLVCQSSNYEIKLDFCIIFMIYSILVFGKLKIKIS